MCYKSAQKGHLLFKRENLNFTIEFSVFESLKVWNFILNRQFWFFGSTFPKRVFPIQIKRTDRCDNIQRIIFVLGTNLVVLVKRIVLVKGANLNITIEFSIFELLLIPTFLPEQTILSFWIQFAQKGYFRSKTGHQTQNIWTNLSTNFIPIKQFFLFGPNLSKKYFSREIVEYLNITVKFSIFESR